MNIPKSTLKSIAVSAGISAGLSASASAGPSIAAASKAAGDRGCVAPQPPVEAKEAPQIAICRVAPPVVKGEPKVVKPKIQICEKAPHIIAQPKVMPKKFAFKTSKQIFAEADKNKDGKLSQEEFSKAFQLIVIQEKVRMAVQQKPVADPKLHVVPPHGPGGDCPGCGLG